MKTLLEKFLKANGYSDTYSDFEELYQSHPDYPSLFSITDSLSATGIENLAVRIPKNNVDDLPGLFIGFVDRDFLLVRKTQNDFHLESEKGVKRTLLPDAFLTQWDGLVLAIEPKTTLKTKSPANLKWALYALPVALLSLISVGYLGHGIFSIAMLLLSLTGLTLAILALRQKLGMRTPVVDNFCNAGSNVSCSDVIANSKPPLWLPLADLPIVYFATAALALLLQPNAALILGWSSVFALPAILYSVWLQKFGLKKWCVICLAIGFTVIAQLSLFIGMGTSDALHGDALFVSGFSLALIASGWLLFKPFLEKNMELHKKEQSLLRFKRNFNLFRYLSETVVQEEKLSDMTGIRFGNPDAPNRLSLFVSPSCGFCHKAVEDAFSLTGKFSDRLTVNILFNLNADNDENPYVEVVRSLLSLNNVDPESAKKALIDWHINRFDLDTWLKAWKQPFADLNAQAQMRFQHDWCKSSNIVYTPAKILNGKLYPKGYELEEVRYFFNDLAEAAALSELKAV